MDDLKSKAINAFVWDFSGKMATHGVAFLISLILARLLEPMEFGLVAMVMVIIGVASVFVDVGLGAALIQRSNVTNIHYSSVFYFNVFLGLAMTLLCYAFAKSIATFYQAPVLESIVQAMSLLFIINSLASVQVTRLRRDLKHSALTKAMFIASALGGCGGVALAFAGAGVWSLVAQLLLQGIIFSGLIWKSSKWLPSLSFSYTALRQLWGFGFRMFLSGLLEAIFLRFDSLLIGRLYLASTLGLFQQAKSLNSMVVQYSSGSLMSVLFPVISKVKDDLPRLRGIILQSLGIISFLVFMLSGIMFLVSEQLVVVLFGIKWLPAAGYFQILILSGFGYPVGALLVNVLAGTGKSTQFLRLEIYKKILALGSFYILFTWGIETYLYGLVVVTILSMLLNVMFVSAEVKLSWLELVTPIAVQGMLSTVSVLLTLYLLDFLDIRSGVSFFLSEVLCFTMCYVLLSKLFMTTSYQCFSGQVALLVSITRARNQTP